MQNLTRWAFKLSIFSSSGSLITESSQYSLWISFIRPGDPKVVLTKTLKKKPVKNQIFIHWGGGHY